MVNFIRNFYSSRNKSDFASKVLARYSSNRAVSNFAKELFSSESAETINKRFEKAKIKAAK